MPVTDEKYMQACLNLAIRGEKTVSPNPMVGCIIVYNDTVVAEGYHEGYGAAHAEVNSFNSLSEDIPTTECTVYVNLEPCAHYGKTPPCANLLVSKNPKKVVIGMLDPHVRVAGKGVKILLEAGIDVKVGVLEKECLALNKRFIHSHKNETPFVTLKWAETKDGFMARNLDDSRSNKISDVDNDVFVHHLRAVNQAILVGAGTVNRDNPKLDVRHCTGNNPIKVIISPSLSVNFKTDLFNEGSTLVYNQLKSEKHANYELIKLKDSRLKTILKDLRARGIIGVLVEGGPTVIQAFLNEKAWDEAIILKSNLTWKEGIKAPWIGRPSEYEELQNNDTIKYFSPK